MSKKSRFQWPSLPVLSATLWLLSGCSGSITPQEYLQRAQTFHAQGNLEAGLGEIRNALKEDPDNVAAYALLARYYREAGQIVESELTLRRIRHLKPGLVDWKLPLAEIYLATRRERVLLEELPLDLYDPLEVQVSLLSLRGQAQMALGNLDQARRELLQALNLAPDHQEALLTLARLGLEEENYQAAAGALAQVLEDDPDHTGALIIQGRLEQAQNNPAGALKAFNRILLRQSWNVEARLGRIEVLVRVNELDRALQEVQVLTQALPRFGRALYLEGLIHFKGQDYQRAYNLLQQLTLVEPEHPDGNYLLGLTCYHLNRLSEAREYLAATLDLKPQQQLQVRKVLALVEQHLDRPEQIVQVLEPAVVEFSQDSQVLTLLGSAYLQTGHYTRGTHYLEKAVQISPGLVEANMRLALSYLGANEMDRATRVLEQLAETHPEAVEVDTLLIMAHLRRGDTHSALKTAQDLTQREADLPMAWNLLGLVEGLRGDNDRARAALTRALELAPEDITTLLNLARLDQTMDSASARNLFKRVLVLDPDNLDALLALAAQEQGPAARPWLERAWESHPGSLRAAMALAKDALVRHEDHRLQEIIQSLEKTKPDDPQVLAATGRLLLDSELPVEAMGRLTRVTELWPERVEAWYQLALAQRGVGNLSEAITTAIRALDTQWNHRPTLYLLTELYLQENRLDEAYSTAARLAAVSPDELAAHRLLAQVEVRRGNVKAAVAALTQQDPLDRLGDWLRRNPGDLGVRQQRAILKTLSRDLEGAVADYEQLLRDRPDEPTFLNELAWLYYQLGDPRALATATRAARLAPQRPDIADTLGWILVNQGQIQKGIALLERAAILAPEVPVVRYHLAVGYHRNGQSQKARQVLEALLQEQSDFEEVAQARELLSRLPAG